MTETGNGVSGPFQVIVPANVKETIQELYRREAEAGRREKFLAALKAVSQKLRDDPLGFGDPLYRLPALKLVVCNAASVPPLVINFGVHQTRPLVIIRAVQITSPE